LPRPMRPPLPLVGLSLSLVLPSFVNTLAATKPRAAAHNTTITIGGLFSRTGDGATLGAASEAALNFGARDKNQELDALPLPYHVATVVADTQLTPSIAAA